MAWMTTHLVLPHSRQHRAQGAASVAATGSRQAHTTSTLSAGGSCSSSRTGALQQAAGTDHAALQMRAANMAVTTPCPCATRDAAPGDTAHRRRAVTGQTHRLAAQPTRCQGKGKHRGIRRNTRAARSWGASAEGGSCCAARARRPSVREPIRCTRQGPQYWRTVCMSGRPARGGAAAHEGDAVGTASTESCEPGVLAALLGAVTMVLRAAARLGA